MSERLPGGVASGDIEHAELPAESALVNSIRLAAERPADERDAFFEDLRQRRRLGDYDRNGESMAVDEAIVELIERGEAELAAQLISPSFRETTPLQRAVIRHYEDDDRANLAMAAVNETIEHKIEAFAKQFQDYLAGVDPEIVAELLSQLKGSVLDPESALRVPVDFWADFFTMTDDAQLAVLRTPGSLEVAVDALKDIEQSGLSAHIREFMRPAVALEPTERRGYLASASETLHLLKTEYANIPFGRFEISLLANHRDPRAALDLAIRSFPDISPSIAGSSLNSELDMLDPHTDQPPVAISQEISALLPALNEAFRKMDISSIEAPLFVRRVLQLDAEVRADILPNFIKYITETVDLRVGMEARFGGTLTIHNERSVNALQFCQDELKAILSSEELSTQEIARRLDRFAMKQYATSREYEFVKEYFLKIRSQERNETESDPEVTPPLTAMDRIARRGLDKHFNELGIPESLQADLFNAWMSYLPIGYGLSQYSKDKVKDLTDGEIEVSSLHAARVFYEQLTAVEYYCEQYGTTELVELNEIFGIVNFIRGSAESFHDQFVRWKDTNLPVKNINVAGTSDHNLAFASTATGFFESFGEEGSFYFEASTIPELSRAFVSVGARERQAGRDPLEQSEVRNVVISGHGSPKTLRLGEGSVLNIVNFALAAQARWQLNEKRDIARPNDYSQYIGRLYRIILHACSNGREVPESINISQTFNREYGVPTEASSLPMSGYRVNEEGDVSYRVEGENGDLVYVNSVRHE